MEKREKTTMLEFLKHVEMAISNSNPQFRRKGTRPQNGRGRFPLLGGWITLPAWGALSESRPGQRTGKMSGRTNMCPSLSPRGGGGLGSWLLRGLIHRCSLSTYCVSGTVPVLRIKGELSEARPSRSSRSGRATRRGLSALAGGAGCYWKHRKGNLPSPGRSGEPPPEKRKAGIHQLKEE